MGLGVQKIYDTTDFINRSIKGVTNSLRDAVILVVLILFLFLQNWKATLVPAIAIPVALIGTFALVLAFGFSLNQLTCSVWCSTVWWWMTPSRWWRTLPPRRRRA